MALPDAYNRYIYCFNSPVIFVNNNGLLPSILVGAIGGAIINTVSYAVGAAGSLVSGAMSEQSGIELLQTTVQGAVQGGVLGISVNTIKYNKNNCENDCKVSC